MATGERWGMKPAGLGARDTLRLEAGMMLNGQDMSETVTPLQVPYSWLIDWNKEFIGSAVLKAQKNSGIKKKLAGLEMTGRGIARHGYKVFNGEKRNRRCDFRNIFAHIKQSNRFGVYRYCFQRAGNGNFYRDSRLHEQRKNR